MNYPNILAAIDTQLACLRAAREVLLSAPTSASPSILDETLMKLIQEKPAPRPALTSAPSPSRGQVVTFTPTSAAALPEKQQSRNLPAKQPHPAVAVLDEPETDLAEDATTHPRPGRRGSRRLAPVVSGALGGARPAGPVFVPAAAVAATRPTRAQLSRPNAARPAVAVLKPREGTLDALLRDYARGQQNDAKDPQRAHDLLSFGM